jgi:hypothetical protein
MKCIIIHALSSSIAKTHLQAILLQSITRLRLSRTHKRKSIAARSTFRGHPAPY